MRSSRGTFAAELFAIHPTYVHEAEEEIVFLADAFLSHIPEASGDVPGYRSWVDTQDFAPAYRWLRRMLQLLQWQKRRRGEPLRPFVLKTPDHLGYLDVLLAEFPDAHIVHSHRDPVDVIPSGASLNTTLWRTHCDDVDPHEVGAAVARADGMGLRPGRRRPGSLAAIRSALVTDLEFVDAVADPIGQVSAAVPTWFGLDLTGGTLKRRRATGRPGARGRPGVRRNNPPDLIHRDGEEHPRTVRRIDERMEDDVTGRFEEKRALGHWVPQAGSAAGGRPAGEEGAAVVGVDLREAEGVQQCDVSDIDDVLLLWVPRPSGSAGSTVPLNVAASTSSCWSQEGLTSPPGSGTWAST